MKKVKYLNLNDYDLSAYEELKGDILYRINGGKVMDQADMYAMQQADAHHDEETKEGILKNYENTETPSSTPPTDTQTTPPATNTTPQQTTALTTEEQVEMAKKDAEKKNNSGGGESPSGGGGGSGSTTNNNSSSSSGGAANGGADNYNGSVRNTENNNQNNKDYPDFIDSQTKTINVNINSNKNIVQGYVAYKILSDKGYVFRLVDGSNVVHTFSSVEAVQKYIKAEAIIQEEKKVEVYVRRIEQDPNNYSIEAYQRKALAPYLRKKDVVATHSLYVINEKSTGVTSTLSFNGTGYTLFSEGAWKLNSKTDVEGWENYKNGFNNYDMEIFLSKEVINVKETAGKIIDSINSNTKYYALDHVFDKPNMENCNTALYSTVDYNHYGKK